MKSSLDSNLRLSNSIQSTALTTELYTRTLIILLPVLTLEVDNGRPGLVVLGYLSQDPQSGYLALDVICLE